MYFERRLWQFTEGVRPRIVAASLIGLAAVGLGMARLMLLAWLIAQVFAGRDLTGLVWPIVGIAAVMVLRGAFEHWRVTVAHRTAAKVQRRLRRTIYDRIAALGPGAVAQRRSGALASSLIDGVEQLEVYFGQFLPQFSMSLLAPVLIFVVIAFIDLPVATVMLGFALIALFGPGLWHKRESGRSAAQQKAYSEFAAEFLDSVQGLATLKAFGQSGARASGLEKKAQELFRRTMWVLGLNVMARGITDSSIACGAAAGLALGAWRVTTGDLSTTGLLMILMLGVEVYRPMRELRSVLHQGMTGMAAAKGIYRILDARPEVAEAQGGAATLAPSIAFERVLFRYPGTTRVVHDGLDFAIAPGERIGVVGASGGGKSSIIRLLLRFYDPEAGKVSLGGRDLKTLNFAEIRSMIAVVTQDSYLFHGTIEENIRMGKPEASQAQVEAAAQAANIHTFIAALPLGYQTLIGERGIKLSGGQRQRVAIARALLRDAPILVLDEALSAVDAENEAVIQQALDRLMQGRTTLVLAHRLSSVIGCDRILVLDEGKVVEEGRHDALMRRGGIYAHLMAEQATDTQELDLLEPLVHQRGIEQAGQGAAIAAKPVTEGIIKAEGLGWVELVTELMKLVMPWKGRLTATFLLGVARVIAFIGIGVLSALALAALKNGQPFSALLWALAVLAPLSGVLHWGESWIAHDMAFRLLAEMRIAVFRKLDVLAPAYLTRRRTGDLMALATHDIELVEYFFAHTVAPAFVAVLVPATVIVWLASAHGLLALALLPFLAAVAVSPFLLRHRIDRLGSKAREAAGELGAFAIDFLQGIGEIVAFQQETRRGDALDALSDRHIALRRPFLAELSLQQALLEVFTGLGGLAVVIVGGVLAHEGAIDAAILPLLSILAMAAFLPVSEISQVGRQLADTLGSTRRLYGLFNEPVVVTDGPGVPKIEGAASLTLRDIGFRYPMQDRAALDGVGFTIPAGMTVALVGPSGAGKTTTAQLLMRFWDPDQGGITMNGHDLRHYRLDDLRRQIALVAQDTYLFNELLGNNIAIAQPDASPEALDAAIQHAALGDLVASLPDGLDTMVGERGTNLSGGQRQRVAIARAFLKDAPVLILDEATSHLDALSEQQVRRALDLLEANRTTIVIAHRLSTVRDADLIVVLDGGRVVETGRHEALLGQGGLYARLVSRQLAGGRVAAQ